LWGDICLYKKKSGGGFFFPRPLWWFRM